MNLVLEGHCICNILSNSSGRERERGIPLYICTIFFLVLTQGHAYWFLERGEGRERERERNVAVREKHWPVASCTHAPWQDRTYNPGMCEAATFQFAVWCSNWATPAKAVPHLIHPAIYRVALHLSHVLATTSSVAVNIGVRISLRINVFKSFR